MVESFGFSEFSTLGTKSQMYAVGVEWSIPLDVLETTMEEALSFIIGLETYKQVREPLVNTFIQSMKDREVMLPDNFRCAKKELIW